MVLLLIKPLYFKTNHMKNIKLLLALTIFFGCSYTYASSDSNKTYQKMHYATKNIPTNILPALNNDSLIAVSKKDSSQIKYYIQKQDRQSLNMIISDYCKSLDYYQIPSNRYDPYSHNYSEILLWLSRQCNVVSFDILKSTLMMWV